MAEPVRVRRLNDQEGQKLQQIVRRGSTYSVRYRRAMILLASAGGNRVRDRPGLCLAPQWAGGRLTCSSLTTRTSSSRRPPPAPPSSASPSPAGPFAQTRRLPAESARPLHPHRPRGVTVFACPPRRHLPADQDVEGVARSRARRQARPHRAGTGALSGPGNSRSTSSGRSVSGSPPGRAGPNTVGPSGIPRPATAPKECATSTAVTRSATTPCGASTVARRVLRTPWLR